MSYTVKLAETEQEYLGIRRLNHRTFASELGQHETTADELLADRFEHKSRYIITLHGSEVIGMVAIHDQPPFSIAQRLPDASLLDRIAGKKLEVRLLAIDPAHRNRMVRSIADSGSRRWARRFPAGRRITFRLLLRVGELPDDPPRYRALAAPPPTREAPTPLTTTTPALAAKQP